MTKSRFLVLALLSLFAFGAQRTTHAFAAEAPKATDNDANGKKKGPDDTTGGRFAGDPIYIHMSPMVLPVINENGVEQLVTIIMDVQVKDFDAADQMHTNMPRVQDALMRALYGGLGAGVLRNGKLVDINKIKNKSVAAVGEVIGIENVHDVLIQGVSQRMF
jgi:hypothetical protein